MAFAEYDTGVAWSFGLEIDGIEMKDIQEVSGLKLEVDDIEMKANTTAGQMVIKKLPGRKKAGEITLTRGLTLNKSWADWIKHVFDGDIVTARKGGSVKVYDYKGDVVQTFNFLNGWPKSLEVGSLKAGDTTVLTETLTITHEGLELA